MAWSVSTLDEVISIEFDESPLSELVVLLEVALVKAGVKFKFPAAPSSASICELKPIISFMYPTKGALR